MAEPAVRIPAAKVALSTASTYPEPTAAAFEMAAALGYDGVEVMVWTDPVSQDADALRRLSDLYGVPVLAVHAPCLIITQRVWGTDPMAKLVKAQRVAERLGAEVVVVHPPFRWQREYVRDLRGGIAAMESETAVKFAVENMFPLRARGRTVSPYAPDYHPFDDDYPHFTLDLSHTSVSRDDAMSWYADLGDRVAHVHLGDGDGGPRDEHLVPGRGGQPCAQLLEALALHAFSGVVVVEINPPGGVARRAGGRPRRVSRLHPAAPRRPRPTSSPCGSLRPSSGPPWLPIVGGDPGAAPEPGTRHGAQRLGRRRRAG